MTPEPNSPANNPLTIWGSWILVFSVFAILIGSAISRPSEQAVKSKKPQKFTRAELLQVRFLLASEALIERKDSAPWKEVESQFLKDYKPSPDRDVVVAFARYRQNQGLTQTLLKSLQSSSSSLAKDALLVFQKQKFTAEDYAALEKRQKMDQAGRLVLVAAAEQRGESQAAKRIIGTGLATGLASLMGLGLPLTVLTILAYVAVVRHRLWLNLPPMPLPAPAAGDGAMLGLYGVLVIAAFQIFTILSAYAGADFGGITGAISGMLFIVLLLIGLDKVPWHGKSLLGQMHQPKFSMPHLVGIGALAYGFLIPIMLILTALMMPLIERFSKGHPAQELTQNGLTPMGFLALAISAAFVAPIWEEITFRGLLWGGLQKLMGSPLVSLILTSFLFAAIHAQGPALWAILGAISVVSGLAYRVTGSIVPSIVLHAIHNFLIVLVGYVSTL